MFSISLFGMNMFFGLVEFLFTGSLFVSSVKNVQKISRRNCAVLSCNNSWYTLEQWSKNVCEKHNCNLGQASCDCPPPFRLIPFPTERKDREARLKWTTLINRKNGIANWVPNSESRICSKHFIDGEPSTRNPYPTLDLGYSHYGGTKNARAPPSDRPYIANFTTPKKKPKISDSSIDTDVNIVSQNSISTHSDHSHINTDHDYLSKCDPCSHKSDEIKKLREKIKHLSEKVKFYKHEYQIKTKKEIVVGVVLQSDEKCKFYTGIPTVESFHKVFNVVNSKLKKITYWKGPKKTCNPLKHKNKFCTSKNERVLTRQEEFIFTLMKLRLGLLLEDLADRFGVSKSYASSIFTTWVKLLSKTLGALVFNPSKEVVKSNLPPSFKKSKFSNVRHIIDCSEVFLEKPNNPEVAYTTWSDYKHHHSAKFLLSINPSGLINFVSDCYGGRCSDKFITQNSGFLDMVEHNDTVMADKGFPIREDLALIGANLHIPPGRRGVAQMSTSDVRLTKELANRRIHVEQAIKRVKSFRSLKFETPLTLLHLLDDSLKTICGICNLYPPIPRYMHKKV